MNDATRESLENLAIARLRAMEKCGRQIEMAQSHIDRLRDQIKAESQRVDDYLDIIAKSDQTFNKDAWLNHVKREWLV